MSCGDRRSTEGQKRESESVFGWIHYRSNLHKRSDLRFEISRFQILRSQILRFQIRAGPGLLVQVDVAAQHLPDGINELVDRSVLVDVAVCALPDRAVSVQRGLVRGTD